MITIENTSYGYKSNPLIFNNISLEIGNGYMDFWEKTA